MKIQNIAEKLLVINGATAIALEKYKPKYTDLGYLKNFTKNNSTLMAEMIEVYMEETPQLIDTMRTAIDTKNWASLKIAAHSIIPSFSIMGINMKFENTAKKIHRYSEKKDMVFINKLFLQMEEVCNRACEELKTELEVLKTRMPA